VTRCVNRGLTVLRFGAGADELIRKARAQREGAGGAEANGRLVYLAAAALLAACALSEPACSIADLK
jgi:hypothetical protein